MNEAISIQELSKLLPAEKTFVAVDKGELYRHLNEMESVIKTLPSHHKV